MIGFKSANLVNLAVYQKHARISSATNKEFSSGEVCNFVQVDAQQLEEFFWDIGCVTSLPITIGISFVYLFHYLDYAFFASIVVFFLSFIVNGFIGRFLQKNQVKVMKCKDERMNDCS
jgi:ABC-type transport system involved in cytochrome bd biosynthesis fused ATPase/permease subunit